jgi:hypothetical protein
MWAAVVLALAAAASYVLMGLHWLGVGNIAMDDGTAVIPYVAAGGYLLGGLLILLRRRWLWIVGAVINGLVLWFFFSMYSANSSVLLSAGGLASKAAQVLLEIALLWLIVADWRHARMAA